MSQLTKLLGTDKFSDLVEKINTIIDFINGLSETIKLTFQTINKNDNRIEQLETDSVEVTSDEMDSYLETLYKQ